MNVTIANGESLSTAANLDRLALVGIVLPSSWTAASLTFQACETYDGTYVDLYDTGGTEVECQAVASRWIAIAPQDFLSARYLKVRSGTSAVPVNQGAARTITLVLRPVIER